MLRRALGIRQSEAVAVLDVDRRVGEERRRVARVASDRRLSEPEDCYEREAIRRAELAIELNALEGVA